MFYQLLFALTAVSATIPSTPTLEELKALKPPKTALKNYKDLVTAEKHLTEKHFAQAKPLLQKLSNKDDVADIANFYLADVYNSEGAWARARQMLQKVVTDSPFSSFRKEAREKIAFSQLKEAEFLGVKNDKSKALRAFDLGFQAYSEVGRTEMIPFSSLQAFATICKQQPSTHSCFLWAKKLTPLFPKAALERKLLQDEFPGILDERTNYALGGKSFQTYKGTDLDVQAYQAAFQKYFDKSYSDADKAFTQFLKDYPRSNLEQRARWFKGLSKKAKDDTDEAKAEFEKILEESPWGSLGMFAALELGKEPGTGLVDAPLVVRTDDPYLAPNELFFQTRSLKLIQAGTTFLAKEDVDQFKPRTTIQNDTLLYWVYLANQGKNHGAAFQYLTELISRNAQVVKNKNLRDFIFPTDYWEKIKVAAEKSKLDPILAISLIKQESAFDSDVMSGSNAMGLMQVIHATALEMNPKLERRQVLDVDINLDLGTEYLARMIKRFNGNIAVALAAYNAGPERADAWVKEFGNRGLYEFIEKIPFKETQNYVGSIIRNYIWYSQILYNEKVTSTERFWVSSKK